MRSSKYKNTERHFCTAVSTYKLCFVLRSAEDHKHSVLCLLVLMCI